MGLSLSLSSFFSASSFNAVELASHISTWNKAEKMASGRKRVRAGEIHDVGDRGVDEFQSKRRPGDEPLAAMPRSRKRGQTIAACTSPRTSLARSSFNWYDADIWTEVAKYLDGSSLLRLSLTNRWFHRLIMDDSIWRYAFLRDAQLPPLLICRNRFKWTHLYASAFDGRHAYTFRQQEKHIDWMRIGAFCFESPVALLMEKLAKPRKLPDPEDDPDEVIDTLGACLVENVRTGIWIADLQLVRCPVCNLSTCEGTMQILDARHAELFLETGYKTGKWDYVELGSHHISKASDVAAGAIFDLKHLTSCCSVEIFDLKKWVGKADDWQPKARIITHAVAVNTNLQPNEGLHVKFQVMRTGGEDSEVVSIRISQQLV